MRVRRKKQCRYCQKKLPPYIVKKGGKYCSKVCFEEHQLMSTINGPVKGFRIIKGYIQLYQPSHPKAIQKKYVPLHRLLIELKIGRTLNENEVVHHKDGNKKNNDLKNLEIMEKLAHDVLSARFRKRNERGVFIRS